MNKNAFTLAEVLITLGIIGVVAAMTLPIIKNKAEKQILKNQYKKAYNTVSNALARSYVNNGGTWYDCYYHIDRTCLKYENGECVESFGYSNNTQCNELFNEMKTILKVIKVCNNKSYEQGCIPDMKGADTIYTTENPDKDPNDLPGSVTGVANYSEQRIKNTNATWILSDGTIMGFYTGMPWRLFWLDINGHKKPNKWGYDIFAFSVVSDGQRAYINADSNKSLVEKGGKTSAQMLKELYE